MILKIENGEEDENGEEEKDAFLMKDNVESGTTIKE